MKSVNNFSKEIKKDLKETNRNSTETITIRVTSDEKNASKDWRRRAIFLKRNLSKS